MERAIEGRLAQGPLNKPIIFALYTSEKDHCEILCYKEITSVVVRGNYPNGDYAYNYPGIKKAGFYPPSGAGKWFSGTLVVGTGTDLEEGDKEWMIRDHMDFRILMDMDSPRQYKVYYMDFPVATLELQ